MALSIVTLSGNKNKTQQVCALGFYVLVTDWVIYSIQIQTPDKQLRYTLVCVFHIVQDREQDRDKLSFWRVIKTTRNYTDYEGAGCVR